MARYCLVASGSCALAWLERLYLLVIKTCLWIVSSAKLAGSGPASSARVLGHESCL